MYDDSFSLIAELSLGLAGFGGVAAAFGGLDRRFTRAERTRLGALFFHASLPLAVSLAGTALLHFELPDRAVVSWSCGLALLVQVPGTAYLTRAAYRFAAGDESTTWPVFWAITTLTGLTGVLYAAGLLAGGSMGLLMSGLAVQLMLGVWVFTRVLMLRD